MLTFASKNNIYGRMRHAMLFAIICATAKIDRRCNHFAWHTFAATYSAKQIINSSGNVNDAIEGRLFLLLLTLLCK